MSATIAGVITRDITRHHRLDRCIEQLVQSSPDLPSVGASIGINQPSPDQRVDFTVEHLNPDDGGDPALAAVALASLAC